MLVGQQIGPFLIDKELGCGAMGTVYRGVYTESGLRVAIKIMAPGLGTTNSNAAQRFEREASILKQLRHPNIVRLFGVGKTHGTRYYAMEYIEGDSLDKVMARRDRMTWEDVVSLGQQLCSALQHAHEKGVIHRDLKPSNLMILRDGTLKLTDFGIAKDLDSTSLTSANCTVGTASYMSPEQCRGERDLTSKSDLYSLGIVFYELVTGRKPFNADNAMEMFMMHVSGTFERPSRLVPELPVWFDNLICQLLEKKPEHRPLDAAMVASTLNTIQEKVEAQLSAGVDVARSRKIDRPRTGAKLDEADREAARALKGGKRKGKRKVQKPQFYERAWFMVAGVAAILAALGGFCYFAFVKPSSQDQLYTQAKRLMDTNDPAKWDEALDGPLAEFKKHYADAPGDKADQMRHWFADAEYRQCFEQIKTHLERIKANRSHFTQTPEQEIAFPAAVAEEEGDFDKARKGWEALQEHAGPWGVFAKQRLQELNAVDAEEARLLGELDKIKQFHRDLDKDDPELDMLTALRYARFRDYAMAQQRFEQLKVKFAPDLAKRLSYLLAAKKVVDAKKGVEEVFANAVPTKVRQELLDQQLQAAKDQVQSNPSEAFAIVLNIIALYRDNPEADIQKRVQEATDLKPNLRKSLGLPASSGD